MSKYIRRALLPRARKLVHCTQFGGGFNGGETAFTHLYARCAIDARRSENVSSGILFLDVVAAFACMLRRSIFPNEDGDETWLKSLRNMGFSESDVKAIYETVLSLARWDIDASGNLLSSHDGSDKLAQMLAKHWYTHTWMTQEGLPGAFITNIGCMAGTPLADLAFTISISRILYILRKTLYQDDLESHVIINGNRHTLHDVSLVDDTACPVSGEAREIIPKVAAVARAAYGVFGCFGLQLNFSSGKSECMLALCGRGKKEASRFLAKSGNCTRFEGPSGREIVLLFVKVYKHVGTRTPFDSFAGEEVGCRCAFMRQTFNRLRKLYSLIAEFPWPRD